MSAKAISPAVLLAVAWLGILSGPVAGGRRAVAAAAQAAVPPTKAQAPGSAPKAKASAVSFVADVMPLLDRLGCNATQCHGSGKGRGGLRLSMFGAYPKQDYAAITREAAGRRINRVEPLQSLFLLKATAKIGHKGGKKVPDASPEYKALASWLAAGAPWGDDNAPKLVSIKVAPQKARLDKGRIQQLSATAVYSDGAKKDVTADAHYRSSDTGVAVADAAGKVKANNYGQAAIIVTCMRRSAVARVVVPQALAAFPKTAVNSKVDELILARLKELGLPPSELCSDQEFLRRVYLDVIGILPTPQEARAFLSDGDPRKRGKLIDRLLEREEYADFWALKWGDLLRIKSEFPSNLWPNGVQAYYRWVWHSIATNKPYDRFVTELLTATGSNFRSPPANYYRALRERDAQGYAEAVALVFMGARLGCARCHGHPTESWTIDDNLGMAAFFSQVRIKNTREWKEEIVYVDPRRSLYHPVTRQRVAPKFLDGQTIEPDPEEDRRAKFAQWLTAPDNPWFARNLVNRMWCWLFGRGIVHEPDDMRSTNPPANPELLDYLAKELVSRKYDLKHMFRLILGSRTYQLSSKPNEQNAWDAVFLSHYPARRLGAEQLLDAIGQVTETSDSYMSRVPEPYTRLPPGTRAAQVPDGSIVSPFLELFGRPPRDTAYESDRCLDTSMRQALYMINSSQLENKVSRSPRIQRLLKARKTDAEIIDELFLAALSRFPTKDEKQKVTAYLGADKRARTQAIRDLMWALLNTKEFMHNH